jgi:AAA domain
MRADMPDECDEYLSPNPTNATAGRNGGRGTEAEVSRVAALYADIDVKAGACPSIEAAQQIVEAVSAAIGEPPAVVIFSGGGLQPIWTLEHCDVPTGLALLRRFGRLVQAIGAERNIKLDSVFDGARVLRIPGSTNWKYEHPVEVAAWRDDGDAIDPAALDERLAGLGIETLDGDDRARRPDVVVTEDRWPYALETCGYAKRTIGEWQTDPVTGRHPWLLCCLVRLECMRRNGCLTRTDYAKGKRQLEARFHQLLSTQATTREPGRYEVADLLRAAVDKASRKNQAGVDAELGDGHLPHLFEYAAASASSASAEGSASASVSAEDQETNASANARPGLADKLLTRSALAELPTPTPLIDNVLDKGTVALLYGKWGTGKSFIALDWAASVATGRNWQGRPTERLRVLYIAAEGRLAYRPA